MLPRNRIWRLAAALIAVAATATSLAGCGSSSTTSTDSGNAQNLLRQTFSASHKITSGVLKFALTLTPAGSSTLKGPMSLNLNGPFQSHGTGKLPSSDFSIAVSALGHRSQLGVVSTGASGYVTLAGAAYQLPAADFQKLKSSFSGAAPGGSGGGLSRLGIDPLHWLTNPTIVGTETVGGASTTHLRAGVNVGALLSDFNTFLHKEASSAATGSTMLPSSIPSATREKIAAEVKDPTVDIWTGTSDKALRRLMINLTIPVSGQASTLLGGLSSAGLGLTLQYAELNQPQTISAPANVRPFAEFATKVQGVMQSIEGSLGAGGLGGIGSGSSGSGSTGSSGAGVPKYTKCIQQAAGDVPKMQKCASLLNGG